MNLGRLVFRNLFYHWRSNVAVLLGVAVGTAVLTGALLVGDSLRGSLRARARQQLGWVDQALIANRFLREDLARELGADYACPAILLRGSASKVPAAGAAQAERVVGRITVLGVDERFWPEGALPVPDFWRPENDKDEVALSASLAQSLGVGVGDEVLFSLQAVRPVEHQWLLGQTNPAEDEDRKPNNEKVVDELRWKVRAILPDSSPGIGFSLTPSAAAPRNALVPLRVLQRQLHDKDGKVRSLPDRPINAIFVKGGRTDQLQGALEKHLQLEDWGVILLDPESRVQRLEPEAGGRIPRSHWSGRVPRALADRAHPTDGSLDADWVREYYRKLGCISLESRQQLLDHNVTDAALAAAKASQLTPAPTLVYIANTLKIGDQEVPYSLVAALNPALPAPLGPFLPAGVTSLADDEIVLVDWITAGGARPGDPVTLTYFDPKDHTQAPVRTATFRLRGFIPLQGVANDPDLAPSFPGITDQQSVSKWDPPPPFDRRDIQKRIKKRDEDYWRDYRTTPKAYVTLKRGQELWGSSGLGELTSIRLAPVSSAQASSPVDLTEAAKAFKAHFQPETTGLSFDAVKERSLRASAGSSDFSGLFLGFSVFLIAAALLLVGLLFRLGLDRRAAEVGLLLAVGYRLATLRWLLLAEGCVVALGGALLGLVGAQLYAGWLLNLLTAWWPGGLESSFLRLHSNWQSFAIGYGAGQLVSILTIVWAVFTFGRVPARALLAGSSASEMDASGPAAPPRRSVRVSIIGAALAVATLVAGTFVKDHEMKASLFFLSGALLLTAALAAVWAWMRSARQGQMYGGGMAALGRLGVRNAARHPVRSLLTAGLLAAAAFVILAVQAFHQDVDRDTRARNSGTGGFALLGEANALIFQDLNTAKGRAELRFPATADATLADVTFYPCRLQGGDDASCLNLYQPQRPRLLSVPHTLVEQQRFRFADTQAKSAEERANPWLLLEQQCPDDGPYPAIVDATTAQWILDKKLGDVVQVMNTRGEKRDLRIVALLEGSIFQSELLVSESSFQKLFPTAQGYNFFLIDAPAEKTAAVKDLLERTLAARGFEVTAPADRLKAYLQVENTYLATFQALGGLGLLLGALGLAIVLLRSIWERRGELALLRALGYRRTMLGWLVLAENSLLLAIGLGAGTLAALLAVAPHLLGGAGDVPWLRMVGLLVLVVVVGLAAGAIAVATTLRAPLVPALRRE